jgi:AMMECR1 domain-containing protein
MTNKEREKIGLHAFDAVAQLVSEIAQAALDGAPENARKVDMLLREFPNGDVHIQVVANVSATGTKFTCNAVGRDAIGRDDRAWRKTHAEPLFEMMWSMPALRMELVTSPPESVTSA